MILPEKKKGSGFVFCGFFLGFPWATLGPHLTTADPALPPSVLANACHRRVPPRTTLAARHRQFTFRLDLIDMPPSTRRARLLARD